jgi:hypothetical protein
MFGVEWFILQLLAVLCAFLLAMIAVYGVLSFVYYTTKIAILKEQGIRMGIGFTLAATGCLLFA